MSTVLFARSAPRPGPPPPGVVPPASLPDYIKILAGLIPAEILAAHAVLIAAVTTSDDDGKVVTISEAAAARWAFIGLAVTALVLYLLSLTTRPSTALEWLRALVPTAAFTLWCLLQRPSVLDGFDMSLESAIRDVIAVCGALVLAGFVKRSG